MSTYTPRTTLLLQHLQTRLQTLTVAGGYRTNVGNNVSLEREQAQDADAPLASVRMLSFEYSDGQIQPERTCQVQIEVAVPCTVANAETEVAKAIEDVFELFRVPTSVALTTGVEAYIATAESAALERPEGAIAVLAQIGLVAVISEP